jgi:hypothetical protein
MTIHEYKRRAVVPLVGIALVTYYFAVLLPLSRRARSYDEPLQRDWRKLAASLDQTNATSLDFVRITNQLVETRRALAVLDDTRKKAVARLELAPELRGKLSTAFQLVDFQYERSKQQDLLEKEAKTQQTVIDGNVFTAFPEHTADTREPSLLWAALAFADDLLNTAVRCKVAAIHSLDVPLPLTNTPSPEDIGKWAEIPLEVEFTASTESALRVLRSLPLRAEEVTAPDLPKPPPNKAPLFIDRLIIRKQTPEKTDEVRVWVRALGFVLRE